jgi:hypothetical protein
VGTGAALLAYTAVFATAAWPWLAASGDTVPHTMFGNRPDERLVAYILAWGAHALGTRPLDLFAMPINYPAPRQLTGSEHLLSTQILFAPCFWLTGNAVLAANLATFATYPLGAAATYWLAVRIGCDPLVAFAAGLALVLGPGQVPAHLHLLQYPVLFLPLVAGMLTGLRSEPVARRVAGLGLVTVLALFSSYYTCVLTALVAGLWALAELCRPRAGRLKFVVLAGLGLGGAAFLLGVFSRPYLARPELTSLPPSTHATASTDATVFLAGLYSQTSGVLLRCLAVLGLVGLMSRAPGARAAARRGLLCSVVGGILMLGPGLTIDGGAVPLPYAAFVDSPLRFFRYPHRFVGVVAFGRALLVAGGLQAVRHLLPRRLGTLVVLGATAAIVTTRAPLIAARPWDTIEAVRHPIYEAVGRAVTAGGEGSLLELPMRDLAGGRLWTEADAMVGQTRHWVPLVGGHTGYQPPHRALVEQLVARLPDPAAIQTLVDLTHVRWLLLRPRKQWGPAALRRATLARAPWATPMVMLDGWMLLRIDARPAHHDFFAAIARGWRPGETALGTPVAAVPVAEARASVTGRLPEAVTRAGTIVLALVVTNEGDTMWPVNGPTFGRYFDPPYAGEVLMRAAWRPAGPAVSDSPVFDLELPRDLRAHESLAHGFLVPTPLAPGTYDLELAVRQRSGEGFTPPATRSLQGRIEVR